MAVYDILMAASGGSSTVPSYWLSTAGEGSGTRITSNLCLDSSQNVYLSGQGLGAIGSTDYLYGAALKFSASTASISNYASSTTNPSQATNPRGIAVDSLGNYYSAVQYSSTSGLITKYNSSGAIVWKKYSTGRLVGLCVDSNNVLYSLLYVSTSSTNVVKYASDGSVSSSISLTVIAGSVGGAIKVDTSGNIYIASSNASFVYIVKLNSSGTILWQKRFTSNGWATLNIAYNCLSLDSSGNVYFGCYETQTAGNVSYIIKLDSSGNVVYNTYLYGIYTTVYAIDVDSSQNVYFAGTTTSGPDYAFFGKLDSSGTSQFIHRIANDASTVFTCSGIAVNSSGDIFIGGWSRQTHYVAKLPPTGLSSGTYAYLTFSNNTTISPTSTALTVATPAAVSSAGSITSNDVTVDSSYNPEYVRTRTIV